jgi:hypothetical protein
MGTALDETTDSEQQGDNALNKENSIFTYNT